MRSKRASGAGRVLASLLTSWRSTKRCDLLLGDVKTKVSRLEECPKCGNSKHQEIVKIDDGEIKQSEMFRCKACGHIEYMIQGAEEEEKMTQAAVERMGDAFREFLEKKQK